MGGMFFFKIRSASNPLKAIIILYHIFNMYSLKWKGSFITFEYRELLVCYIATELISFVVAEVLKVH